MPAFSIVVATYNHERFINDCIQSVTGQTFPDWEMIILDDGSTDNTGAICREWVAADPRISYICQSNKGILRLYETNNHGLEISKGKYISILEGDDFWENDKLQKQFDALESHPEVVLCWGRVKAFSSETGKTHSVVPGFGRKVPVSWTNNPAGIILNDLCFDNFIPAVTISIRKSALIEIGGFQHFEGYPTTDYPTILQLACRGQFYFCDDILAAYRIHSNQITKVMSIQLLEKRIFNIHRFIESLPEEIKSRLTVDSESIERHFKNTRLITYVVSGRHKLIRKDFTDARKDFKKAVFLSADLLPAWRIWAITGIIFSFFHADMEGLLQAFGKTGYKTLV
jgi:glycosyltransferase involved in cell wall biosynthesis